MISTKMFIIGLKFVKKAWNDKTLYMYLKRYMDN